MNFPPEGIPKEKVIIVIGRGEGNLRPEWVQRLVEFKRAGKIIFVSSPGHAFPLYGVGHDTFHKDGLNFSGTLSTRATHTRAAKAMGWYPEIVGVAGKYDNVTPEGILTGLVLSGAGYCADPRVAGEQHSRYCNHFDLLGHRGPPMEQAIEQQAFYLHSKN